MSTPKSPACPSFDELSTAFTAGAPEGELGEHLATCEACTSVWRDLTELRDAARAMPWQAPTPERAEALEAELLERALFDRQLRRRSARRQRVALTISAIAASIIAAFVGARGWNRGPDATQPVAKDAPTTKVESVATVRTARPDDEVEAKAPRAQEARVRASAGATFARDVVASERAGVKSEEVVHLAAGSMTLEVPALEPDRRFLLVTDDAEVVVADGVFTAVADAGRLVSVEIVAGRAEVRPKNGPAASLGTGERWPRPTPPTEKPVTAALSPSPEKRASRERAVKAASVVEESARTSRGPAEEPTKPVEPTVASADPTPEIPLVVERPTRPEGPATPGERAFAEGWEQLRNGDVRAAIAHFEEAEVLAASSALAEDAAYWKAVALGRAKRTDDAIRAMSSYLERHARSARRGEVAAMLGWLWMERGAIDSARARFAEAAKDPSPRVRESAERGLEQVERARTAP